MAPAREGSRYDGGEQCAVRRPGSHRISGAMRTAPLLAAALCGLLIAAAPAAASSTTPPPGGAAAAPAGTTTPATPKPKAKSKPKPRPAGGALKLRLSGALRTRSRAWALTGQPLRISGVVSRYAPGQRVTLRLWRGRRLVRVLAPRVFPSRSRRFGRFSVRFASHRAGRLTVGAIKPGNSRQIRMRARPVAASIVTGGGDGASVAAMQAGLARLGYWVPRSGRLDAGTGRALMAFRKVNGMARTYGPSRGIVSMVLRGRGGFRARYPGLGKHVEADLGRQVLVFLYGRRVHQVFGISSGKPSTPTILGTFRFYSRELGTNSHGMVDSSYFYGGYAVHGYADVPPYAASHGCLRTWIPNARAIHDWIRVGDPIAVYP